MSRAASRRRSSGVRVPLSRPRRAADVGDARELLGVPQDEHYEVLGAGQAQVIQEGAIGLGDGSARAVEREARLAVEVE